MGLLFGAGAGLLIMAVGTHLRDDHFDDFTYWIDDDGICYGRIDSNTGQDIPDMGVRVRSHIIKGRKAYL
jgi:hypothetical protein